jgi:hypothetical protein
MVMHLCVRVGLLKWGEQGMIRRIGVSFPGNAAIPGGRVPFGPSYVNPKVM